MLIQPAVFNIDGRFMARWSAGDKRVISQAKETLSGELQGKLSAYCTHVKHHGDVKKSLRLLTRVIPDFAMRLGLMSLVTMSQLTTTFF
jgi:hypothetical protein